MPKLALKLATKDYGHNKFLESIYLWLLVTAPRYFWQEADTYRIGTKQSESTMHTALNMVLTQENFSHNIDFYVIDLLNNFIKNKDLDNFKRHLPESFLQTRLWVINYKTLNNIIIQRHNHRLQEWKIFIQEIYKQIQHKELLYRYDK